jgi:hypothetical protein
LTKHWHSWKINILNVDSIYTIPTYCYNEEEKVTEMEVTAHFCHAIDHIAVNALKSSEWQPVISHNKKIRQAIQQP